MIKYLVNQVLFMLYFVGKTLADMLLDIANTIANLGEDDER